MLEQPCILFHVNLKLNFKIYTLSINGSYAFSSPIWQLSLFYSFSVWLQMPKLNRSFELNALMILTFAILSFKSVLLGHTILPFDHLITPAVLTLSLVSCSRRWGKHQTKWNSYFHLWHHCCRKILIPIFLTEYIWLLNKSKRRKNQEYFKKYPSLNFKG